MDTYFDIKAIPDPELLQSEVVAQLMQSLHGLLPAYQGRVGVGFPGYGQSRTLGGILRLHGNVGDLKILHQHAKDHSVIRSYALITEMNNVPGKIAEYGIFKRLQVKGESDVKRLINRHKIRGTWTTDLEASIRQNYSKDIICPHVKLRSQSTNQPSFLLFVQKSVRKAPSETNKFNSYGLSQNGTTVPLF